MKLEHAWIIANVTSHLATEGSSHDSDDDNDDGDSNPVHHALPLAPYAAVSRGWRTQTCRGAFHGAISWRR